jgi:phosphate/sulfate permease
LLPPRLRLGSNAPLLLITYQDATPWWILLAGGVGISLGLAMWGYRVMSTIGTNMTKLTPSRGFNIGTLL